MLTNSILSEPKISKKPKWIRVKLPTGKKYNELRSLVDKYKLNTICYQNLEKSTKKKVLTKMS